MDKKLRGKKDVFAVELHWWDDHPAANPETEPMYASILRGHVAALA